MTINDIRAAIMRRLIALNLTENLELDGELFDPKSTDTWLRLNVRFNTAAVTTLGGSGVATRRNRIGTAYVNVFTPLNVSVANNDDLCNTIQLEFENQYSDPCIRYGQPTGVRVDTEGRDGTWYLQTVVIPFTAEIVL